jgi:hypothetical protein
MTTIDPSALEVPAWMTLTQAATILESLIRDSDRLQVLLDAIEAGEIEMRLRTANDGVALLPRAANLHLKPDNIDWANSCVFTNRLLFEPGVHAGEESLAVRISRVDFMERFKRVLSACVVADVAKNLGRNDTQERIKPRKRKGSSYSKADTEVIELMRPLVRDGGLSPTRAVQTLLAKGVTLQGISEEKSKIKRLVDSWSTNIMLHTSKENNGAFPFFSVLLRRMRTLAANK